jgi:cbb3-type cytochrome oxidase subunit 3
MEGLIVLVAFSLAFTGIAIWAYLPRNKSRLQKLAYIPLHEDDNG